MKISISYPPLENEKGVPLLSQNRQFQWFKEPTYIYPMVSACAATLLKKGGHEVLWNDGIAEKVSYTSWMDNIAKEHPDLVVVETKTPVVKRHWRIINQIKEELPDTKTVFVGDHVTALPKESLKNSSVDFVITGGDYDFSLVNLANWLDGKDSLQKGVYYRKNGKLKNSGKFVLHDLSMLPFIDRDLTRWRLYSEKNGNYKRTPGTYSMVGRDCWWAGCTFCSWTTIYPKGTFRVRSPENLLDEVGMLIERYGVREIFDDTGTFPIGNWLKKFCDGMIERGYNREIFFSCNMRFGALSLEEYKLMKKAGFRMLLFGLESASQKTLDRINKNVKLECITKSCKKAKESGLEPHLTMMLGYPWEKKEDALKTFELAKYLFENGYADTLQATITIPYPGTPLFKECKKKGLLLSEDWSDYDMRRLIMKTEITEEDVKEITQKMYRLFFNPRYVLRKIASIRDVEDFRFVLAGVRKVFGHITDFSVIK